MRLALLLVPALLSAAPAFAQSSPSAPVVIPPELSDPAMADKLARMAGVLAKSMMDLPVGELEAAIAGREATAADRAKRVRDEIGGPAAEQQITAGAAASGQMMQAATRALVASLPALMKSLEGAERELEKAVANIPDPTYPKR